MHSIRRTIPMASCRWCTNKEIYCDAGIARLRLISHTYEDGEGDLKRRKLIEDANAEDDEGDLKRRKLIEEEALRRYAQQHAERLVADWCCTCCRDVPKTEMIQLDCSTQRINECKMCNKCYYRCKKKCPCCKGNYR